MDRRDLDTDGRRPKGAAGYCHDTGSVLSLDVGSGVETPTQILYGLHQALDGTDGMPLIVVAGPFSVFRLTQAGHPTVATLGSFLSDEQAAILAETKRPIVLMFDGNAHAAMRSAAGRLITRTFVRAVKLAEDEQPDRLADTRVGELLSFLS